MTQQTETPLHSIEIPDWFFDDTINFLLETAIENRIVPDLFSHIAFSGYERRQVLASQDLLESAMEHIPEEEQKLRWSKAFINVAERNSNWEPDAVPGHPQEYLDELEALRGDLRQAKEFVAEQEEIENDKRDAIDDGYEEGDEFLN